MTIARARLVTGVPLIDGPGRHEGLSTGPQRPLDSGGHPSDGQIVEVVLREPDIDLQALLDRAPPAGVHRSRDRATLRNIAALRCRGASWITLAVGLICPLALLDAGDAWIGGTLAALAVSAAALGLLELRRVA